MIRKLLGGVLTLAALTFSQQTYAEEKPKQQQEQTQDIIQKLNQQDLEAKLRALNKSRTKAQLPEFFKGYVRVLKGPLRESSPSLLLKLTRGFYRGTKDAVLEIVADPKMHLYIQITAELRQAEKDFRQIRYLTRKKDLPYPQTKRALEAYTKAEPIILAATHSFPEISKSKNPRLKTSKSDKNLFKIIWDYQSRIKELAKKLDMKEREIQRILQESEQELHTNIRKRAERTREWRTYIENSRPENSSLYEFSKQFQSRIPITTK